MEVSGQSAAQVMRLCYLARAAECPPSARCQAFTLRASHIREQSGSHLTLQALHYQITRMHVSRPQTYEESELVAVRQLPRTLDSPLTLGLPDLVHYPPNVLPTSDDLQEPDLAGSIASTS
ncbi:hypothetical protein E2C01_028466 [Portunus trituberculatus]|uniref:Uncharacterized protein n=1 Tax=Portunus trituberculatus TaxID=210409 RepID=A0A5B7EP68_PORTR|nr:hypothetical protein [Portunus trituberculatus]